MRDFFHILRSLATDYEPATARIVVLAFLHILVAAGIGLGNLPTVVDAVLAFVAVVADLLAGRAIRKAVYSPSTFYSAKAKAHVAGYAQGRDAGYQAAIRNVAEGQS